LVANEKLAIDGGEPLRREPFAPRWDFGEPEKRNLRETIDRASEPGGSWGTTNQVREFEDAFARRHGVNYAIATDSGTGAIHAAVGAVNPEPGDEIITTPTSDIGTVLGIMLQNAVPVFADWDPDTFNTDPADLERRVTDRTRAIIAVHLFGNPCDMDAFMDIGRRYDLPIIEDCSHAHLSEYQGKLVGTVGDMGCFSLGSKLITAAGGGMFISDDEPTARRAKGFAAKGSEYDDELRNSLRPTSDFRGSSRGYEFLGDYHHMSPLMAAVGYEQLKKVQLTLGTRRRMADIVDDMTEEVPGFVRPRVRPGDKMSYYVYCYKIEEEQMGASPQEFSEALAAEGIDNTQGILAGQPLYKFPLFAEENTYGTSKYPFYDEAGNRRIDYPSMELPVVERELPKMQFISASNFHTEDVARDIGTAVQKVADYYYNRK
jgi:dTDP-4-amino-4,6-dideoxygalactose transaminase